MSLFKYDLEDQKLARTSSFKEKTSHINNDYKNFMKKEGEKNGFKKIHCNLA